MVLNKWLKFVKKHMSAEMKRFNGSHAKAMKSLGAKWRKKNKNKKKRGK